MAINKQDWSSSGAKAQVLHALRGAEARSSPVLLALTMFADENPALPTPIHQKFTLL